MRMLNVVLVLTVLATIPALAEISISPSAPRQGEPVEIRVLQEGEPLADVRVTATFRPRSQLPRALTLGTSDAEGVLHWTPPQAGLVTLAAEDTWGSPGSSLDVGIRYARLPRSGLATLLVAGCLLFGGVARGFHRHLRGTTATD